MIKTLKFLSLKMTFCNIYLNWMMLPSVNKFHSSFFLKELDENRQIKQLPIIFIKILEKLKQNSAFEIVCDKNNIEFIKHQIDTANYNL